MAIFRDFKSLSDRSYKDRLGNWQLVKEAMRENIEIIAEEAIIAKRGDELVMVPIKEIKEFRFIYQEKNPQTGQGGGDVKPGDIVGQGKGKKGKKGFKGGVAGQQGSKSGSGGDEPGVEMYEKGIPLPYDELLDIIFDDVELPGFERKKLKDIFSRTKRKIKGLRKKGIRSRLHKKKTAIQWIKRKKSAERGEVVRSGDFPFHQEDLRYKRMVEKEEKYSNAVIYFIRDVSGSMGTIKRYLTKIFFLLLYLFVRAKYRNVDLVYIGHHTQAKEEKDEKRFFNRVSSGGTHISSGYEKALEIIEERYNPEQWNIYVFHCSDGDNAYKDNDKALELAKKVCEISNLFGYCEVKPSGETWGSMIKIFNEGIKADNFAIAKISKKGDIYPMFKSILRKEKVKVTK